MVLPPINVVLELIINFLNITSDGVSVVANYMANGGLRFLLFNF